MRKIKFLTLFFATAVFLSGCKQNENVQFDTVNGQTIASFQGANASMPVDINTGVGSVDVQLNVTTSSTTDRTVNVSVVTEKTTADAAMYSFNSSVIIPAGSYNGTLSINGTSTGLNAGDAKALVLAVSSIDNGSVSTSEHTVNLFLVCPVPEGLYTGSYLIEQTSPYVDGPSLSDGSIVDVTALDNDTRIFQSENYPQYCNTFRDFTFNLVCGQVTIDTQDTNCRCADATGWFSAPTVPETFSLTDDSTFLLTFTDDTKGDCGPPQQTTYKFTKQ
jgi:hypothetical protein